MITKYSVCLLPVLPVLQRLFLWHGNNFFRPLGRAKNSVQGVDISEAKTGSTGSQAKKIAHNF